MTDTEVLIDTIQNGKKQFIKKYMKHPELSQAWNKYIDTQTIFMPSEKCESSCSSL